MANGQVKKKHKTTGKNSKNPQANGRNGKGQFAKGNTAGEGKKTPSAIHKQRLTEVFKATVTSQDIIAIAKKLVEKAKKGDYQAAKDVLDRCLGKPKETLELGGIDGQPITVRIVDFGKIKTEGELSGQ